VKGRSSPSSTPVSTSTIVFRGARRPAPPFNTGTPAGDLDWENVDLAAQGNRVRLPPLVRSVSKQTGMRHAGRSASYDNQGHGTLPGRGGRQGAPVMHDYADSVAPAAVDHSGRRVRRRRACTQFPGVGCPAQLADLRAGIQAGRTDSLEFVGRPPEQAQNPPTANYPQSAYDITRSSGRT
jgi:hypothetical protein